MANFGGFIGGSTSGESNRKNNSGLGRNIADFGSNGSGSFGGNSGSFVGNSGSFGGNTGNFGSNTTGSNNTRFGSNTTVVRGNTTGFGGNTTVVGGNTTCFGGHTRRFSIGISGRLHGVPEYLQNDAELRHLADQIHQERKRKAVLESGVREAEQTYIRQSMARGGGSGAA